MSRFGLRARFLTMLFLLIVGLQAATSFVVLERTRQEAELHADEQLEAGGRVFERLVAERERQLVENVSVLVGDFGLRRAVATADRATVVSALDNHGARIRSDLAFWIDRTGRVAASTPKSVDLDGPDADLERLLAQAKRTGRASGIAFVAGHPHQVVIAAVNAPILVGWIGMGFELDRELASDLRQLTGLEVSFWSSHGPDRGIRLESTLPPAAQAALAEFLVEGALPSSGASAATTRTRFEPRDGEWFSLPVAIASGDRASVGAVLQTSRQGALAGYSAQRSDLIAFVAAGLGLAFAAALWTARRLTQPIGALAEAAAAISSGDLQAPVAVATRRDEIGQLAQSFRVMQQALGERERRIRHDMLHDRLTGLPNRNAAPDALGSRLARERGCVVLMLDVVRLKDINDNLGTSIGDEILIGTARRLQRSPAVVWSARVGGDEFLLLLDGDDDDRVSRTIDALVADLEAPHDVRGARIVPRFRAGLAVAPRDGEDVEVLMRRAEMAVALAKADRAPRACYVPGLEESNHRRVGILIELERALEVGDLELHYQPKVSMRTGRVVGCEALIRWRHAKLGPMNPQEFIGIAEQAGLIGRISEWVLDRAVRQAALWSARGIDLNVGINLSADDAASEGLFDRVTAALARHGTGPEHLRIEVTESVVMTDPKRVSKLLERVRDRGVGIAIDDFGTGHSSLAQLQTLPCDELKIDQAFVRGLRAGTANAVIVRTTIEMAHSLGLHVVAEGVEDRASWNLLAQYGCDVAQGYFLGRPMPAADFVVWLDRFKKEGIDG